MEKRFRALRFVALVWKILAWLLFILLALGALLVVIVGVLQGRAGYPSEVLEGIPGLGQVMGPLPGVIAGVGVLIAALIQFVLMYAAGEVIDLGLAIEQNTRETAYYLK
ncbi:MAG: hypothetical protein V1772_11265, partial [Chloroflexota bacterium]